MGELTRATRSGAVLVIHRDRCTGHAQCNSLAPDIFRLDERGYIDLPERITIDPRDLALARRGADSCPERVFDVLSIDEEEMSDGSR